MSLHAETARAETFVDWKNSFGLEDMIRIAIVREQDDFIAEQDNVTILSKSCAEPCHNSHQGAAQEYLIHQLTNWG